MIMPAGKTIKYTGSVRIQRLNQKITSWWPDAGKSLVLRRIRPIKYPLNAKNNSTPTIPATGAIY
jgi:hypothetical protein